MTVIFIALEFPPINSAGVYRPLRFINALAERNIQTIVISFEIDENLKKVQGFFDATLVAEIHPKVNVVRVPIDDITEMTSGLLGRIRFIMNNAAGDNFYNAWKKRIFSVVEKLIAEYSPTLFVTSCPPFSSAMLCRDLSKKFQLPFILDMRDAWSGWAMAPQASYFHYLRKKKIEGSVFKAASAITTVTPQLLKKFRVAHPYIPENRFKLIYNSPNFTINQAFAVEVKKMDEVERMDIGYTGSFYFSDAYKRKRWNGFIEYYPGNEDWLYRTPFFFFKALKNLFLRKPEWKKKIFFNYIGAQEKLVNKLASEFDIRENVIIHGYLPHDKVRELEQNFDVLLCTSEKVMSDEHYCLPSKIFGYLLAQKPVFAFTTKGVQTDFITSSGIGIVFNPDAMEASVQKLVSVFQSGWKGLLNLPYVQQFDKENTNEKFISLVCEMGGKTAYEE